MIIRYFLLLVLSSYISVALAQPIQKHGPSEVHYTQDLIEGKNNRLFLSATGGIYTSDDLGDHWHKLDSWINTVYFHPWFTINERNGDLYAWDYEDGIFSTADNGTTWKWELSILPDGDKDIGDIGIDGDTLFVGTKKGLKFFYGPDAVRFSTEIIALQNKEITALHVDGKMIIAGTKANGVFISEDVGKTWADRTTGLPDGYDVKGIAVTGQTIFVYSGWMGVYYSTDKGLHWTPKNTGFAVNQANKLFIDGDILYAATNSYDNIYKSDLDDGAWTLIDAGIPDGGTPNTLYASGSTIIAGYFSGVYKSVDGAPFIPSYDGITDAFVFRNMVVGPDGTVWAVASHTGVYKMEPGENTFTPFVRGTANYGTTTLIGNVLPVVQDYTMKMYDIVERAWKEQYTYINVIFGDRVVKTENDLFISSQTNGIFQYNGTGIWDGYNVGLGSLAVKGFTQQGSRLIVGTDDGLYTRAEGDAQWNAVPFSTPGLGIWTLCVKDDLILLTASDNNSYLSADGGEHWELIQGLKNLGVTAYLVVGDVIYVASFSKLYMSVDGGKNWLHRQLPTVHISSMAAANGKLLLGTLEQGIWSTSLKLDQAITFTDVPETIDSGSSYTLAATSSSGLPITYTVISGPAVITGNVMTFTGEGDVVVSASQAGDDIYNPVTKDQTFKVKLVTGIERETFADLNVFPNPASSKLYVTSDSHTQGKVRIISVAGESIVDSVDFDGYLEIQLGNVSSGLYYLLYTDGLKTEARKVVLNRDLHD
jgi:photosystem II stability/assembly factor-like uncharacterized protein